MPNLNPSPSWPDVYQIEKTDRVLGGDGGIANAQAQQLLNRTEFIRKHGGALPWVDGIVYADGAVVVKDGSLAILDGGNWHPIPGKIKSSDVISAGGEDLETVNAGFKNDLSGKAGFSYVDEKVGAIANGAQGSYPSLEDAMKHSESWDVNGLVYITKGADAGLYQWDGEILSKSDYDPLEMSKLYSDAAVYDAFKRLDQQTVKKFLGHLKGVLVSLSDAAGNRTWIEANDEDGGPTDLSLNHIFKSINAQFRTSSSNDFFFALSDKIGFATDMTLDQSGLFAEFVVERLAPRIAEYLVIPEPEIISKKPLPTMVYPNMEMFSIWGSSSVAGMHPAMKAAAEDLGFSDIYLGGKGSERMQQTCARFGSHPVPCSVVGGVIPASGRVDVKVDWEGTSPSGLKPFDGTLNGIHGKLAYKDRTTCTFTRSSGGSSVQSRDTYPFIPDLRIYRDGVIVLNLAKNNLSTVQDDFGNPDIAFKWTKESYEYARAFFKYVIILGHFLNNDGPEEAKTQTLRYNTLCEDFFEDRYVDIQEYLSSSQVWIDAGIEPTQTDLDQQAKGEKPESLSNDIMHLNPLGSQLVVNKVKERLIQLNWSNNNA